MELSNIELRIAGKLTSVVPKLDVTPAEILILRHLHGEDAVVNVRPTRMDRRNHAEEWTRLVGIYGRNGASSTEGAGVALEALFPGAIKTLPVHLADIGINATVPEEPASVEA